MSHNRFAALNRDLGDGAPRQRVRRLSVRILFICLVSLALPLSQTASPLAAKPRRGGGHPDLRQSHLHRSPGWWRLPGSRIQSLPVRDHGSWAGAPPLPTSR
jgi:hypothetical protein